MSPGTDRGAELPVPDEALRAARPLCFGDASTEHEVRAIAAPVVVAELRAQAKRLRLVRDTTYRADSRAELAAAAQHLEARADQLDS